MLLVVVGGGEYRRGSREAQGTRKRFPGPRVAVFGVSETRREDDDDEPGIPPVFERGLTEFLEVLRVEAGLARNTLLAYRADLERFFRWAVRRGLGEPEDLTADLVVDYMAARRAEGAAEATVAHNLVSIRMFVRHWLLEGVVEQDSTILIPAPVLRRALPHTLTIQDVEALLEAPKGGTWSWGCIQRSIIRTQNL